MPLARHAYTLVLIRLLIEFTNELFNIALEGIFRKAKLEVNEMIFHYCWVSLITSILLEEISDLHITSEWNKKRIGPGFGSTRKRKNIT